MHSTRKLHLKNVKTFVICRFVSNNTFGDIKLHKIFVGTLQVPRTATLEQSAPLVQEIVTLQMLGLLSVERNRNVSKMAMKLFLYENFNRKGSE